LLKIYYDPVSFSDVVLPVATIGTFDGVHLGHKFIIQRLCDLARFIKGESVLITFDPHPRIALKKDEGKLKLLNTPEEKAELLELANIRHMVIVNFTKEFSLLTEQEFVTEYLVKRLNVSGLVVGYNHHFGNERKGDYKSLHEYGKQFGFHLEEMPRQEINNTAISSTRIRNALAEGNLESANEMLGYLYPLSGVVIHGNHLGHSLGFPTANIKCNYPYKLIPANGVYVVRVTIDKKVYGGMCNIGIKPTFERQIEATEVNVFNFEGDLYNKEIKLQFVARLRDEMKFDGAESLIRQLNSDKQKSQKILEQRNENK
jgi:riboflavin kinase / FMN adenylyltransferase